MLFWVDERPNAACCLFASDDDLRTDPDAYDCQTCVVADALGELWPDNMAAWSLYRTVLTRFAYDLGLVGMTLDRLTKDLDAEQVIDLMTRLAIIYDVLHPVPVASAEA